MNTVKEKISNKPNHQIGATGMFENPFIDKITRTNSFLAISLFYTLAFTMLCYAVFYMDIEYVMVISIFLIGWISFTFLEYILHRYLFHMDTSTETKKRIQYNIHGMHHDYPKDKDRLAMPLIASIPLALVLFVLFSTLLGDMVYMFLPGIMTGYSTYLLVHYLVHAYPPPKNFFKFLWVNHAVHHYRGDQYAYGVSSPLWDYIFGTMPKKRQE